MIAFFQAIAGFFSSFNAIVSLIKGIWAMIREWNERQEEKRFLERVRAATEEATKSKDTSKIEDIFRGK